MAETIGPVAETTGTRRTGGAAPARGPVIATGAMDIGMAPAELAGTADIGG